MIWFVIAAIIPLLYYLCRYVWELIPARLDKSLCAVFISGCDTGFGRLLALKCAHNGFPVYAGCFTKEGEQSFGSLVESGKIVAVPLDVTNDESVKEARKRIVEDLAETPGKKLWALVNNAGVFSIHGPSEWCTIDDYQRSMDVNLYGSIRCTQSFLPEIKASMGRVITVTSVAGRIANPFAGPYCAAKFACEAYMDVIRMELKSFGVTCCIVEPGIFRTPLINETHMHARADRIWATLAEETKKEYGETYKEKFVNFWNSFMLKNSSTCLNYVVDNYFHAISARFPRLRYRCGYDALFFYIPLSYMPTWFIDYVFLNSSTKEDRPIPAAVLKAKTKTQ